MSMEKISPLVGVVKNTFLHFSDADSDDDVVGYNFKDDRPNSDPTSSRGSSMSRSDDVFKCHEPPVPAYVFRNDLQPPKTEDTTEHGEETGRTERRQKKYNRPNQSRRKEFRRYLETLKQQLEQDPEGFDCRNLQHPQKFIRHEGDVETVVSILERHRAQVLAQNQRRESRSSSVHTYIQGEVPDHHKLGLLSL